MIVLKHNEDKDTYTLKGLTYEHLSALKGVLQHVILGQDGAANVVRELLVALEAEEFYLWDVSVKLDSEGYFSILVE